MLIWLAVQHYWTAAWWLESWYLIVTRSQNLPLHFRLELKQHNKYQREVYILFYKFQACKNDVRSAMSGQQLSACPAQVGHLQSDTEDFTVSIIWLKWLSDRGVFNLPNSTVFYRQVIFFRMLRIRVYGRLTSWNGGLRSLIRSQNVLSVAGSFQGTQPGHH